jgi:predicted transcriptional regulator
MCMRTTLNLDDELLAAAKRRASETGRTLTAVIEEALAAALAARPARGRRYRLKLRTHAGRYIGQADVADRDALYDSMEGRR